jgi:hypothetical protein
VAQRKTLNEEQVAILRWISEGCPDGVMADDYHRISAAALRRRGLVTTSGRGPSWSAVVTDEGRRYLEEVDGEDPPVPRQANVSVTQQLVDDVIAAGGTLRVPRWSWRNRDVVDYRHRARQAEHYRKVPAGKRLEVLDADEEELEIRLLEDPENPGAAALVEIALPDKVARYHPAARRFRDDTDHHEVSRAQLKRAMRIVHALAGEAERRGWSVPSPSGSGRTGRLGIATGEREFWISISEKGVKERGRWDEEVERWRDADRYWSTHEGGREYPSGPYDAGATGELNLHLGTGRHDIFQGHQSNWGDRASWRLESRLPYVIREIEERVVKARRVEEEERIAAERRAEEERKAAEERERRWQLLMERARQRLIETRRAAVLRSQAQAWEEARRLLEYCDAMEAAYGENADSSEWIAWAREFATRLDPLSNPPVMPDPPEETPEALQEHLSEGWSVHGPEHGRHHLRWYGRSGY